MTATTLTVGVLALQGAFVEHISLLRKAATEFGGATADASGRRQQLGFDFIEVRTPEQLGRCDALVIPGGESTTLAFVAVQTKLMEPLRQFVRIYRKPTWGTCAGLILLAEEATGSKKGGQELVGGLHVRAHRNHFGRQVHSFQSDLDLPFLKDLGSGGGGVHEPAPRFPGVFIRAPVVEKILPAAGSEDPAPPGEDGSAPTTGALSKPVVEVLGVVSRASGEEDIIAVRQENIFATSFHPELTGDIRIHLWWLQQVVKFKAQS